MTNKQKAEVLKELSTTEIPEPTKMDPILEPEPTELTLKEKIQEFVNSMKGKTHMTNEEAYKMFDMYGEAYKTHESHSNVQCSVCVQRVYSAILEYLKNN